MKKWLFTATFLVIVGLMIFAVVMSEYNWNFNRLSTTKYESNIYETSQEFSNISINTDASDITFVLSDDGKCKIECYEDEKEKHSVTVDSDTLVIKSINEKFWYDYIGISFESPRITVYLPKSEYTTLSIKESTGDVQITDGFDFKDMKISTSTGDIRLEEIGASAISLSVSTGDITLRDTICKEDLEICVSTGKTSLNDIECKKLISAGNTGDISLKNVISDGIISIERTTGRVTFDRCDASEVLVETDTGDVSGTFLSDKIFIVETSTGDISVPTSLTGGKCEITTDTGDITIDIA